MGFHLRLTTPPTCSLRPINPDNARPPRITAAAGTELAGAFSGGTVKFRAYSTRNGSSLLTGLYTPKSFITHAALLRQPFGHCAIFLTAASRRSLGRISVPVWPVALSGRLPIVALVGHYPTNKLMGRRSISWHYPKAAFTIKPCDLIVVSGISTALAMLSRSSRQVTYVLLTRSPV